MVSATEIEVDLLVVGVSVVVLEWVVDDLLVVVVEVTAETIEDRVHIE